MRPGWRVALEELATQVINAPGAVHCGIPEIMARNLMTAADHDPQRRFHDDEKPWLTLRPDFDTCLAAINEALDRAGADGARHHEQECDEQEAV